MFPFKIFWLAAFFPLFLSARNIEILTPLPFNITSLGSNIVLTGAAFDLAVENVNSKYKNYLNVSVKYFYNSSHRTCDEMSSTTAYWLAEYYYRNRRDDTCYATVMSSCIDHIGIMSLSKELNWSLFSIVPLPRNIVFKPKTGSPTGIAVGGSLSDYATVVLEILVYYNWYHATVLLEVKPVIFYKELGNLLLEGSRAVSLSFALEYYSFDPSSNESITTVLKMAKSRSRGQICSNEPAFSSVNSLDPWKHSGENPEIVCYYETTFPLQKMADQVDMANGEYVYLNVQSMQSDSYGRISQFTHLSNDTNMNAFRSLFFIAYRSAGSEVKELNSVIAERSRTHYNTSYINGNQPLDSFVLQASYDLVELFAKVVNDSNEDGSDKKMICNALRLVEKMTNRTFRLGSNEVYVNLERTRNLNIDIFAFNTSTMTLQSIGTYDWANSHLVWNKSRAVDWPTVNNQPPLDIPICGFSGKDGLCATQAIHLVVNVTVAITVCSLLLFALFIFSRWCMLKLNQPANLWQLASQDLLTIRKSHRDDLSKDSISSLMEPRASNPCYQRLSQQN